MVATAGNQSFYGYRVDKGIPGARSFSPARSAPTGLSSPRIGRIVDADNSDADARLPTQLPQAIPGTSTPRGISHPIKGHSTYAGNDAGAERERAAAANVTADAIQTLYKIQNPAHAPSPTKSPTVRRRLLDRLPRARAAPPRSPSSRVPPTLTNYASRACEAASFDPRNPSPTGERGGTRRRRAPRRRLAYERDFGADPLAARAPPPNAAGIGAGLSQRATTSDLNLGTTRATRHVPGYAGLSRRRPA